MGIFNFNNKNTGEKDYFSTAIYTGNQQRKLTEEALLTIPSARAAVELITSTIGQLPLYLYQEKNSQIEKIENNPLVEMFEIPNKYETASNLKKKLVKDFLLYGKAYIYHKKNELFYLSARDMEEKKYTEDGISFSRKELVYNGYNGQITLLEEEVIIIDSGGNGLLVDGGETFQLALNYQKFETALMLNSAIPTGVLKATSRLTTPAIERLRDSWAALYSGSSNTGKTIILEEGLDYKQISMKPNELMLSESKKSLNSEMARLFNLPESMIDSSANKYASNEANRISYLQNCLSPVIVAFEEAFNSILDNDNFFRFSTDEILRLTAKEQIENTTILFEKGLIDKNEARFRMDLPKVDKSENYTLSSLGNVIQHEDGSWSIPNMGIHKGKQVGVLNEKN